MFIQTQHVHSQLFLKIQFRNRGSTILSSIGGFHVFISLRHGNLPIIRLAESCLVIPVMEVKSNVREARKRGITAIKNIANTKPQTLNEAPRFGILKV
jgi:hypothetical protein